MKLARRGMLQALAAFPLGARVAAEQVKTSLLTNAGAAGLIGGTAVPHPTSTGALQPMKFVSFPDWLKQIGERQIREQARHIVGFDADLIAMRLPLATKVRIQTERNYERQLASRREWFERRVSIAGFFEEWL